MSTLFEDYLSGKAEVRNLFGSAPEALLRHAPAGRPWDPALAEALLALQPKLGIARAFRGDEPVIITGQQPGLFLGPMYTLYKAVTTVALARRVRERHGTACVPVFWVASEDHDFDEVRGFAYTSSDGQLVREFYTPCDARGEALNIAGLPMHKVPVDGGTATGLWTGWPRWRRGRTRPARWRRCCGRRLGEAASVSNWFAAADGGAVPRHGPGDFCAAHAHGARRVGPGASPRD